MPFDLSESPFWPADDPAVIAHLNILLEIRQTIVTSGRFGAGTMSDWETWSRFRSLAWVSAGGFSARLGHPSRRAQGDQKSTEGPLHATWREPLGWARLLPGQAVLGDDGSGQPELSEHRGHQPGPAVGRGGGAEPHRGPAQVLFGKAEGMFHGEAPQVPLPDLVQVIWKWTADPGQPQRHRLAMLRQVLELHAHDGEWSSGRILDVQVGSRPPPSRSRTSGA